MFKKCPEIIVTQRKSKCRCSCSVDFSDPCAQCPNSHWGPIMCDEEFYSLPENKNFSIGDMAKSMVNSTTRWAKGGLKLTDEPTLKTRLETCHGCEHWNPKGFRGTGRCMKCGCSTWAKLRMATEKCPIGKW